MEKVTVLKSRLLETLRAKLNKDDFRNLVLDEWGWKCHATATQAFYGGAGK